MTDRLRVSGDAVITEDDTTGEIEAIVDSVTKGGQAYVFPDGTTSTRVPLEANDNSGGDWQYTFNSFDDAPYDVLELFVLIDPPGAATLDCRFRINGISTAGAYSNITESGTVTAADSAWLFSQASGRACGARVTLVCPTTNTADDGIEWGTSQWFGRTQNRSQGGRLPTAISSIDSIEVFNVNGNPAPGKFELYGRKFTDAVFD